MAAITSSALFSLSKTYILLSGIAGTNPHHATLGSVAFAKFCVQVDLQLELGARETPCDWQSGYVPLGAASQSSQPSEHHGTEVFELNEALRDVAFRIACEVGLQDSEQANRFRQRFEQKHSTDYYEAATAPPCVLRGDVVSSNVWFHGRDLSNDMARAAQTYTHSRASYVMTAMEDTGVLAALLRAAVENKVDFARVVLMRAASNFDRPPPDHDGAVELPFRLDSGGLEPALRNLYLVGARLVRELLDGWDQFEHGVEAENYIGDVFGSLGAEPDFLKPPLV